MIKVHVYKKILRYANIWMWVIDRNTRASDHKMNDFDKIIPQSM